jgi:hypothetical protein
VVWVDSSGAEQPTTVTGEVFSMPRLAPDSRRIALAIGASAVLVGALCVVVALLALRRLEETFHKALDYYEQCP